MAARPPPQAARSVLDGGEHDGILTAETDDEAARVTLQDLNTAPTIRMPHTDLHGQA